MKTTNNNTDLNIDEDLHLNDLIADLNSLNKDDINIGNNCNEMEAALEEGSKIGNQFRELLIENGYPGDCVFIDTHDYRTLRINLRHKGFFENELLVILLDQIKSKSINSIIKIFGKNQQIEFEIYNKALKKVIDSFPTFEEKRIPLLEKVINVICHLDSKLFFLYEDDYPLVFFRKFNNALRIEYCMPDGEILTPFEDFMLDRHCIFPLYSKKDFLMADYLVSLNSLSDQSFCALDIMDIIRFMGLEKFGYLLDEKTKPFQLEWFGRSLFKKYLRTL